MPNGGELTARAVAVRPCACPAAGEPNAGEASANERVRLTVAAPAHAVTISRAGGILGKNEPLLWEMASDMEPEDGCLWIYDTETNKPSPSRPPGWNTCERRSPNTNETAHTRGLDRMVTLDLCRTLIDIP